MCQNVQIKIVFINLDFFYHPSKITSAYLFFKYCFKKKCNRECRHNRHVILDGLFLRQNTV